MVCVYAGIVADGSEDSPLVLGRHYIVYGVANCCGDDMVDVGLPNCLYGNGCRRCGKLSLPPNARWCEASLFRKVSESTAEKVIEYTAEIKIEIPEPVLS